MDNSSPERRKHARVPVHFSVFYRIDRPIEVRMRIREEEVSAIMLDLSEGGLSVSTSYNIPEGTLLFINFTLINEYAVGNERTKSMLIDAEVRNCILIAEKEYRLGIQFNYMDEENKLAIRNLVLMLYPSRGN